MPRKLDLWVHGLIKTGPCDLSEALLSSSVANATQIVLEGTWPDKDGTL